MARRSAPKKVSPTVILTHPETKQEGLFPPPLDTEEQAVLAQLNGIYDISTIAKRTQQEVTRCCEIAAKLVHLGEAREATPDEMRQEVSKQLATGHPVDAIRLLRRIITLDKNDIESQRRLAPVLERSARPREAASAYARLAASLSANDDPDAALAPARKAATLQPKDQDLQSRLAMYCLACERIDEAARVWSQAALVQLRNNHPDKAASLIDLALEHLPDHPQLLDTQLRIQEAPQRSPEIPPVIRLSRPPTNRPAPGLSSRWRVGILGFVCLVVLITPIYLHRQWDADRLIEVQRRIMTLTVGLESKLPEERLVWIQKAEAEAQSFYSYWPDHMQQIKKQQGELRAYHNDALQEQARRLESEEAILAQWALLADSPMGPRKEELRNQLIQLAAQQPQSPRTLQARAFLASLQSKAKQAARDRQHLLEVIRSPLATPQERFDAYATIRSTWPEALTTPSPTGIADVLLPVDIDVQNPGGRTIPFRVMHNGTEIAPDRYGLYALPIRTPRMISIYHVGWTAADVFIEGPPDTRYSQQLPSQAPLAPQYKLHVTRTARWQQDVDRESEVAPVTDGRGNRIFTGDLAGVIRARRYHDGTELWRAEVEGRIRLPLLHETETLAVLDETGNVALLRDNDGTALWQSRLLEQPQGWTSAQFTLSAPLAPEERPLAYTVAGLGSPHLIALRGGDGSVTWPIGVDAVTQMRKTLRRPVGGPFHSGWHLLQLDRNGYLHIFFDNGTLVKSLPAPGVTQPEGDPLFIRVGKDEARLILKSEKGIFCYTIRLTATPTIEERWRWDPLTYLDEHLAAPLLAEGKWLCAAFDSGRIILIDLSNGSWSTRRGVYTLPGTVTGSMAATDNLLMIPHFMDAENQQAAVTALAINEEGFAAPAWRFSPPQMTATSAVTAQRRPDGRILILFQAGKTLYCLEEESKRR